MEVIVAISAGFCFGVKRAVETVQNEMNQPKRPIYTYGPIIHNETVVSELEREGVIAIKEDQSVDSLEPGTVIIRSHGVTKEVMDQFSDTKFHVVDATCPFVLKIHKIVAKYSNDGYHIVIIGDEDHPEVQGIIGWIFSKKYSVISNEQEAEALSISKDIPLCIVSQTTFRYIKFHELLEILENKGYNISALNTICNATEERQKEASQIASKVDVMLVIGGKNSSNSQKLFDICKKECENTLFIQTKDDFDLSVLQSIQRVGITAGASTPNKIIEEVQKKCQK